MAGSNERVETGVRAWPLQKWGGVASFVLVVASIGSGLVYLMGDIHAPLGPFTYAMADFLFGPVWAAGLITAVLALRERIGGRASQRMNLALLAAAFAAAAMIATACIRGSNRSYVLRYPELGLLPVNPIPDVSRAVLIVWTTLVEGLIAAGLHFLAFAFVLTGWAGWSSRRLPRLLSALYLAIGIPTLFSTLLAVRHESLAVSSEGGVLLSLVAFIWQGIVLLKAGPGETQTLEPDANQPD